MLDVRTPDYRLILQIDRWTDLLTTGVVRRLGDVSYNEQPLGPMPRSVPAPFALTQIPGYSRLDLDLHLSLKWGGPGVAVGYRLERYPDPRTELLFRVYRPAEDGALIQVIWPSVFGYERGLSPTAPVLDPYLNQQDYEEAMAAWIGQVTDIINQVLDHDSRVTQLTDPMEQAVQVVLGRERDTLLPPVRFDRQSLRMVFKTLPGCCPESVDTWEGAQAHGATIKHVAAEFGLERLALFRQVRAARTMLALAGMGGGR